MWWKWQKFSKKGRKHCGKRRNCSLRAISLFPTVFSKDLYRLKPGLVWERVKSAFQDWFFSYIFPLLTSLRLSLRMTTSILTSPLTVSSLCGHLCVPTSSTVISISIKLSPILDFSQKYSRRNMKMKQIRPCSTKLEVFHCLSVHK